MTVVNNKPHIKHIIILTAIAVLASAVSTCFFACKRADEKPSGPPEKVTIAFAIMPEATLAQVAHAKGFLRQEGLDATVRMHPYGKRALDDLLAGNADFATVAETPVMFAIMKGKKISVIATILHSSAGISIIARKDRGILTPGDLRGKRIGVTFGTISDYFLYAILGVNGISGNDVEVVDIKAEDMPDALGRGDIDAVSTFSPYTVLTRKKLGTGAVSFQDKDIYRWTFNVVATQEFISRNPGKVEKLLRALVGAEEFVKKNPPEAQKITANFNGLDIGIVREIWQDSDFTLTLDQPLILALEDESRWAIKGGLTDATKVPNYLDFIYIDGLNAVKPDAVMILR
jgi:ABC-type nitrate/sulfonate/bicarbonate transport system substrate-binding protein